MRVARGAMSQAITPNIQNLDKARPVAGLAVCCPPASPCYKSHFPFRERAHTMIKVIDIESRTRIPVFGGHIRTILGPANEGTRAQVAIEDVHAGGTRRLASGDRTQVAYILEGKDAKISHVAAGKKTDYSAELRTGIYLEPGEETSIAASRSPLVLLLVNVPKHVGKAGASAAPTGYFFEEARLRSLIDEKGFRERTFWVNKETGLSGSWDLQIGRMAYAPHAHSPRHVHRGAQTSSITPEHFYLIEKGRGEVKHDAGSLPVGPGSLVLIPAGEWHQLLASDTGFDYIEFQAPFDFVTTMDHDPLGKNWYIKGTDDGTGKPQLWVQS
jgi:mannose-6-phosphate isomerase-like protein (cupin superfamily)